MGLKRPSTRLDPAIVARAKEMRLAGATMREIASAVGASRSALGAHFASDPDLAAPPAAIDAEMQDLALQGDALVSSCMTVANGIVGDMAKRLRGKRGASGIGARELREVRATIVEVRKLTELLRGRPTARTETMKAEPMTDGDRRIMAMLEALDREHANDGGSPPHSAPPLPGPGSAVG